MKGSYLIIKIAAAIIVLAAAAACVIVFRDAILSWLQFLKSKFQCKTLCCGEEFSDFEDE